MNPINLFIVLGIVYGIWLILFSISTFQKLHDTNNKVDINDMTKFAEYFIANYEFHDSTTEGNKYKSRFYKVINPSESNKQIALTVDEIFKLWKWKYEHEDNTINNH